MSVIKGIYTCIWWLIVMINSAIGQNSGQGISLTLEPPGGKITPGLDIYFVCTLDTNRVPETSLIEWSRMSGDLSTVISHGTRKMNNFVSHPRYKISRRTDSTSVTYTLTITGVRYEDSGTFTCGKIGSSVMDSKVLAVCIDPSSNSCDCILERGWASPECFGESKSNQDLQHSFDTTVTGLGVCFAIAVIYGVLVTVFFARDCVRMLHKKQKRKELRRQMAAQGNRVPNPYADSEKLTLDLSDETSSQTESGVWSQSDGSNNRNSGRNNQSNYGNRGNVTVHHGNQENITRSRPQPKVQAHMNAAFDPDESDGVILEKPPRKSAAPGLPNSGVRPKSSAPNPPAASYSSQPAPTVHHQPTHSPHTNNPPSAAPSGEYPPNYYTLQTQSSGPVPAPGAGPRTPRTPDLDRQSERTYPRSEALPRTPDLDRYPDRPRLPSHAPPSTSQSEGRGRSPDRYPGNPRGVYTDQPRERHGYPDNKGNYTEQRRLDFIPTSSTQPQTSGPYEGTGAYIDSHDTEI